MANGVLPPHQRNGLPAGMDRFIVVPGHPWQEVLWGMIRITDAGGAVHTVPVTPVPPLTVGIFPSGIPGFQATRIVVELHLPTGTVRYDKDIQATGQFICYATFGYHENHHPGSPEIEPFGTLILSDDSRVCLQYDHVEIEIA